MKGVRHEPEGGIMISGGNFMIEEVWRASHPGGEVAGLGDGDNGVVTAVCELDGHGEAVGVGEGGVRLINIRGGRTVGGFDSVGDFLEDR